MKNTQVKVPGVALCFVPAGSDKKSDVALGVSAGCGFSCGCVSCLMFHVS